MNENKIIQDSNSLENITISWNINDSQMVKRIKLQDSSDSDERWIPWQQALGLLEKLSGEEILKDLLPEHGVTCRDLIPDTSGKRFKHFRVLELGRHNSQGKWHLYLRVYFITAKGCNELLELCFKNAIDPRIF